MAASPLLTFTHTTTAPSSPRQSVTLPFERRAKSLQRITLDDGSEAALSLEVGTVLRGGDWIETESGVAAEIRAAPEPLSCVGSHDESALARAAYHLGNRHVLVEITASEVRYARDSVPDQMVKGLGFEVVHIDAPFEPEAGAYGHGRVHAH